MDPYVAALIAFVVLELLTVSGRIYVRGFLLRAFGKDDIACVVTLVLALAYDFMLIAIYDISGLGLIANLRPISLIPQIINMILATELLYVVATTCLKISFGLLLLRVLAKRWIQITIWTLMTLNVLYATGYFLIILFECGNPKEFATKFPTHQCQPTIVNNGVGYGHATLTFLTDVIFGAMPITYLWNAALNRSAKISVGGVLALGSVGCICTAIRIGWVHFLADATNTYLISSRGIALLSGVELSVGLSCISLATYRPLVRSWYSGTKSHPYTDGSDYTMTTAQTRQEVDVEGGADTKDERRIRGWTQASSDGFGPQSKSGTVKTQDVEGDVDARSVRSGRSWENELKTLR